jgi:hypothetical protein
MEPLLQLFQHGGQAAFRIGFFRGGSGGISVCQGDQFGLDPPAGKGNGDPLAAPFGEKLG